MLKASCPSCGSPVVFANKSLLATICGHCHTVVTRKGIDFASHGKVGEIREDHSPLMVGTSGTWNGRGFTLVGRIQLRYLDGTWSEWAMSFDDGHFAWLAEAMGQYSIQRPVERTPISDDIGDYSIGRSFMLGPDLMFVRNRGHATCTGGEGTLPFPVNGAYPLPFVDLVTYDDAVGTIDFSDGSPKVFVGQVVTLDQLALRGTREELPPEHPMARASEVTGVAITCPSCGGGLEHKMGLAGRAMYCQYCGSGIDLSSEPYSLFARQDWRGLPHTPIELGAKASFEGAEWEVVAIMVREAPKWNVSWTEFLLFNRDRGYRWLMLQDGHFTWIEMMHEWPRDGLGDWIVVRGQRVMEREQNQIRVKQVVGELYWRVKVGDTARSVDYAWPPMMVSREETDEETTWSVGRYVPAREIYDAFGLKGPVPAKTGIPWHQPSPVDHLLKPLAKRFALALVALLALAIGFEAFRSTEVLASEKFMVLIPGQASTRTALEAGRQTKDTDAYKDRYTRWMGPLEVPSGPNALEIDVDTVMDNAWVWFHFSLYDPATSEAQDFGLEVSKYGSEGSNDDYAVVPNVKPGTYWLRIEPIAGGKRPGADIKYTVTIKRDVVLHRWWLAVIGILAIPMLIIISRKVIFESRRQNANA